MMWFNFVTGKIRFEINRSKLWRGLRCMERYVRGVVGRRSKEGRVIFNTGWFYE